MVEITMFWNIPLNIIEWTLNFIGWGWTVYIWFLVNEFNNDIGTIIDIQLSDDDII